MTATDAREPDVEQNEFERLLDRVCADLTAESRQGGFDSSATFEQRVREMVAALPEMRGTEINLAPHPQAFPDIQAGRFGIEVKFTTGDSWRSVANSVLETNRIVDVKNIYILFGKMGGLPDVKWGEYEKCVMHVRTSHVPRFEVELYPERSLFDMMGVAYDDFRSLSMPEKMQHIRAYARSRIRPGERLWWLEDEPESPHSLPIQARLYTSLSMDEKTRLRAEAAILCPQVVRPSSARGKYDDAVLYILTYHGVLCHQARDLFSAGSVANPRNDDEGGVYIERAMQLLEPEMLSAVSRLEEALFVEYWGQSVAEVDRLAFWLERADGYARDWVPSESLFLDYQRKRLQA